MTQITIPLPESLVSAIGVLLAFGLASALVVFAMMPAKAKPKEAIASFQSQMGLDRLPAAVFFLMVTSWGAIFLVLLVGILITIFDTIWRATPGMLAQDSAAKWDWRFSIAKLTALTAVLGAVVALPFTIIRLKLNREQTETAKAALDKENAALINDKMNAAVADLYAQRQITKLEDKPERAVNIWEDDITRRNGAIDRLRGLVEEEPDLLGRVVDVLSGYIRGLNENHSAKTVPENLGEQEKFDWHYRLLAYRSDAENAVRCLSHLNGYTSAGPSFQADLSSLDLQGFNLSDQNFSDFLFSNSDMHGARIRRSKFAASNLKGAKLPYAQIFSSHFHNAILTYSSLQGAMLSHTDFKGSEFKHADLSEIFCDECDLSGCDFSYANLCCSEFSDASMEKSDLSHSKLRGVSFSYVNLRGVFLCWAKLQGTKFSHVTFDGKTNLDSAELEGAAFQNVDLSENAHLSDYIGRTFGDGSVTLSPLTDPPIHWPKNTLSSEEFDTQWRAFQRSIGQDPDNPE